MIRLRGARERGRAQRGERRGSPCALQVQGRTQSALDQATKDIVVPVFVRRRGSRVKACSYTSLSPSSRHSSLSSLCLFTRELESKRPALGRSGGRLCVPGWAIAASSTSRVSSLSALLSPRQLRGEVFQHRMRLSCCSSLFTWLGTGIAQWRSRFVRHPQPDEIAAQRERAANLGECRVKGPERAQAFASVPVSPEETKRLLGLAAEWRANATPDQKKRARAAASVVAV